MRVVLSEDGVDTKKKMPIGGGKADWRHNKKKVLVHNKRVKAKQDGRKEKGRKGKERKRKDGKERKRERSE